MADPQQVVDVVGLANRPSVPNAVQWSADGVLAVAAGHSVVLLSPADLHGPRAFASPGNQCDLSVLKAPGQLPDSATDVHHEVAHLRVASMVSQYPSVQCSLSVRSVAWSPAGCAQAAGCLLATVANDHQILVYGPPAGPKSEWQQVADLSQQLLDHLEATGWRELEHSAGSGGGDGVGAEHSVLRLRGGAKRKRPAQPRAVALEGDGGEEAAAAEPAEGMSAAVESQAAAAGQAQAAAVFRPEAAFAPAVGQAVEVMTNEDGLAGSWFACTVAELAHGWALVAYEELKEDERDDSPPLREWVAVPGQAQGAPPAPRPPGSVHGPDSEVQLRPAPPAEECCRGAGRKVGEACDCLIEGAWWEACRVVEVHNGRKKGEGSLVVEWAGERRTVPRADARHTLRFAEGGWERLGFASVLGGTAGDKPKRQRAGTAGSGGKAAAAEPAQPAALAPGEPDQPAGMGGGVLAAAAAAALAAAAPTVQEVAEPPAKKQRGQQPGSSNPPAQAGAAGADAALASAEAAAAAGAVVAAGADGGTGKVRGKKAAGKASGNSKAVPSYEVPAGFDPSELPPVDVSDLKSARLSVPLAFCRRFLALRRDVPPNELPEYEAPSAHLKGVDAALVARTVAEIMHVHGAALGALGPLDAKWLNTEGRSKLRHVWDRTRNQLLGKFKIAEGESSETETEEEKEDRQQTAGSEGEQGAEGETAQRKRRAGGRTGSAPAQLDFPAHELPEGFSWRDLPGVDPSNVSSAKSSLVLAAVRRFLSLRNEYPADERPTYTRTAEHLRGRDAWITDRVTREFAYAYSQLFLDVGWTPKTFQTYWGNRLRSKWNRVEDSILAGFSLEPEPVDPGVLLAVGNDTVGPAAPSSAAAAAAAAGAPAAAAQAAEAGASQAPAGGDAGGTPGPAATASTAAADATSTPAAGRGPRLQNRRSAKQPAKQPKSSAARSSLSGATTEGGASSSKRGKQRLQPRPDEDSDNGSEGTALTVQQSQARKKKELAADTAAVRLRDVTFAGGNVSCEAYERRLLGISSLSCAWSPAVVLPPGAAAGTPGDGDGTAAGTAGGPTAPPAAGDAVQDVQQVQAEAWQQRHCCFLAVGAKGGRIWLWRYRMPGRYGVAERQGSVGEAFQLVGCLPGPSRAWVTSLAWQLLPSSSSNGSTCSGSLVLAAGYSDGAVVLHGAGVAQLAALAPLGAQLAGLSAHGAPVMQRWAEACPPDELGVSTVAVQLCPESASDSTQHLLVAAGKASGSLAAWRSGQLSGAGGSGAGGSAADHAKQLGSGASRVVARSVQGTRVVTGLVWLPHQHRAEGQPLLLAATQDGAVTCYRPSVGGGSGTTGLALSPVDGAPQPCAKRKKRDQGHCAFGLAVSPGGMFVAVVRLSLSPLAELVKAMQVHERVVQGLLQLDCLAGPDAPLEPSAALDAALTALAGPADMGSSGGGDGGDGVAVPALPASAAWEVGALLRLLGRAQGAAGVVPPLAESVLQRLEEPVHAAVQQGLQRAEELEQGMGDGEEEEEAAVLPLVPAAAWRGLQLATALRHVLDPARVIRGQQQRAKKQPKKVGGGAAVPPLQPIVPPQPKAEDVVAGDAEAGQSAVLAAAAAAAASTPARPPASAEQQAAPLSPEQLAQHGAFASLLMAASPAGASSQHAAVPQALQPPSQQQQKQQQQQQRQQQHLVQADQGAEDGGESDAQSALILVGWQAATERNEMLLLQRQLASALTAALPPEEETEGEEDGRIGDSAERMDVDGGSGDGSSGDSGGGSGSGGGGSEQRLSQLLMADWISLNLPQPLMLPEMLPLAARAYLHAGEEMVPTDADMPERETSSLFGGAPVAVAGAGVAAATSAPADGAALPRCPASLLLCEQRPHWACRACGRRYCRPPAVPATADQPACTPRVPACIFCGLPLGVSRPGVLLNPPCCA